MRRWNRFCVTANKIAAIMGERRREISGERQLVAFRSINALKQCLEGIGGVFIPEEEWDDR